MNSIHIGGVVHINVVITISKLDYMVLQIPLTNLKRFGDSAFCAYAPCLWNEPPKNIKAADSVHNFKKQLKNILK